MLQRHFIARALLLALVNVTSFDLSSSNLPKTLDDSQLRSADRDSDNWLMYGRTYDGHRFSPLNQINEQTVAKLGLAWSRELGTNRGLEATPLVADGVIYATSSWNAVFAIDAKTGKVRWTYDPKVPRERAYFLCCDVVNRGVALYRGKVYEGTLDGRLIVLDEATGALAWSVSTVDITKPYSMLTANGAPPVTVAVGLALGTSNKSLGIPASKVEPSVFTSTAK